MKTFQSIGIIFRRIKYSETSLIVDIFTREKGIRSFIFSGVRKAKAKVSAAMIDHMNIVNIIAYDKDNDKLARVKEIHLDHRYRHITTDVVKSSLGIFLLEMTSDFFILATTVESTIIVLTKSPTSAVSPPVE